MINFTHGAYICVLRKGIFVRRLGESLGNNWLFLGFVDWSTNLKQRQLPSNRSPFRTALSLVCLTHSHRHGVIFLLYALIHEKHTTCRFFFRVLIVWLEIDSKLSCNGCWDLVLLGDSVGSIAQTGLIVIQGLNPPFKEAFLFFLGSLYRPELSISTTVHALEPSWSSSSSINPKLLTTNFLKITVSRRRYILWFEKVVVVSGFFGIPCGLARWCVQPGWLLVYN